MTLADVAAVEVTDGDWLEGYGEVRFITDKGNYTIISYAKPDGSFAQTVQHKAALVTIRLED